LLATCHPILSCFAENIVHAGPVGAGHQMKLLHNYVSLGSVALLSEAAACARRAGVSGETFVQVLSVGGGWGAALDRIKPYVTTGDSSNLRFSVSNALKDLTYYNQMATDTQAHHDIAQAVQQTLDWACKAGDPNAFLPELIGYLSEKS
jgi:3-hydroxyisobutyrate dehydrogenase-like beta-hydroxyacid dehydrogenase